MSALLADLINGENGINKQLEEKLQSAYVVGYMAAKPDTRADDHATMNAAESKFDSWARSRPWQDE